MSLEQAIRKSEDVAVRVQTIIEGKVHGDGTKGLIVASFLSLAMEHHIAILTLIKSDVPSSAAALARPLLEACYRCTWVSLIASETHAEKINKQKYCWESTWSLGRQVDTFLSKQKKIEVTTFLTILKRILKSLHGFTHGGLEQLSRQVSGSAIRPSYTDEELIELLTGSDASLGMTLLAFSANINSQDVGKVAQDIVIS